MKFETPTASYLIVALKVSQTEAVQITSLQDPLLQDYTWDDSFKDGIHRDTVLHGLDVVVYKVDFVQSL
jgi:hypothetical protein